MMRSTTCTARASRRCSARCKKIRTSCRPERYCYSSFRSSSGSATARKISRGKPKIFTRGETCRAGGRGGVGAGCRHPGRYPPPPVIQPVGTAPLARAEFALDPGLAYFNHAAVGVLPIATRDALRAFVDGHAARGVLGVYRTELDMPKFRSIVAGLIDAGGAEIAMLRNTGDGATILAQIGRASCRGRV